ncbi:HugZ family protein [Neptunomonas japonica]|uniref:HugZ family pyridoxamine 5'-phosphate oxidase n=1 Tax=Neptunomonas japonica TaxID=417574 RepID=UPI00040D2C82|nr:pyridoxamine 5'-phosphate oxidase family protein [Neptunomonas japonica]
MNVQTSEYLEACLALLQSCSSLQLATIDKSGMPHLSYAPFIRQSEHFFIFVSQLASHTQHLTDVPNASIMIIKDEADCRNIFARERCTASVSVEALAPDTTGSILDQMEVELGKTMALLRTLPDFVLFKLTAEEARYIAGFGKAFELDLKHNELMHVSAEKLAER